MPEPKTKPTAVNPREFLSAITDEAIRQDCLVIMALMQKITGDAPVMWGDSIIGFGKYRYTYASGRSGEWPVVGFSPRKQNLTLYIMPGFERYEALLSKLGKYKTGKSCLYIKRLAEINFNVLEELIEQSVVVMRQQQYDISIRTVENG